MPSQYEFGHKSAGLIGLSVASNGQVRAFAYQRPALSGKNLPNMKTIFLSPVLTVPAADPVKFRLSLAASKTGLLTIEPLIWTHPYEISRLHFLGMFNPFGTDEIPYHDFSANARQGIIPSNRVFDGTFVCNPKERDPKLRAVLTLTDVESNGQSVETISVSSFDDAESQIHGNILLAIRVNEANRGPACATLEFTSDHQLMAPNPQGKVVPQKKFVLNC